MASAGARATRGRALICRRRLSTAKSAKPSSEASVKASDDALTPTNVALYAAFVSSVVGSATLFYLATDDDFLFTMREWSPALVNLVAPYIGRPVDEDNVLDVSAFAPRDVAEVVGDTVCVVLKTRMGVASLSTLNANDKPPAMGGDGDDPVVETIVLDQEEFERASKLTQDELNLKFGMELPELPDPSTATMATLRTALAQCELKERDLQVAYQLADKYGKDPVTLEHQHHAVQQRKLELLQMHDALIASQSWYSFLTS